MSDDLTMGEISRNIDGIRADVRHSLERFGQQLDTFVLREVYVVDSQALRDRINRLEGENKGLHDELDVLREQHRVQRESDRKDREDDRRSIRNTALGAALSLAVAVVMLVLTLALRSKGAP